MRIRVTRYHDISCGHRVYQHEGACANLHGHNYRIHFHCEADHLDELGRVIDFSVIKKQLCMWLEDNWDHRFLLWDRDPILPAMKDLDSTVTGVPFNPTAEGIGAYLLEVVGPKQLAGTGVRLTRVFVEETMKCSADCEI
jgi:6-pyruvoyltetrahydropterin/6-carboxytetrahydropterin synthase